ncbi:MHC class II regulatory factor RFX1a isoform X2 [Lepisosteus oculatus]|uniref:MHC class II regulatory factor RFX1a isoform X2 n=1 Tax=Lepisosteus oculatus TaxID=7918 RepID=UPI0035F5135E
MATPAYVGELQQSSQPQGGGVVTGQAQQTQPPAAPPPTPAQYMAELQSAPPPQAGQSNTTPATPSGQKSAPPAGTAPPQTPTQTQYVTAEIQSSPTQPGSGQGTAQYIVVTVTEGSLHPSDSVSESSPPPAVVQTGVPTQVVQQVQNSQQRLLVQGGVSSKGSAVSALQLPSVQQVTVPSQRLVVQAASPGTKGGTVSAVSVLSVHPVQPQGHSPPERSVVQAAPQTAKTGQSAQLSVTNLQQVHLTQESPGSRGVEAGRQRETERERGALQWGSVKQIDSETDGQPPSRSPSPPCSPGYDRNYSSLCPAFHPSLPFSFPFSLPLHFPLSLPLLPPTGTPVTVQPLPQLLLYETAGATALRVQQLQQVPVQHVYSSQVQYVEGGDAGYTTSTIRSGSYSYSETPLYNAPAAATYYEPPAASGSQVTTPVTSQAVSSSAGGTAVSMFVGTGQIVANPSTGAASATGGTGQAGGTTPSGGAAAGAGGSYVIQGGYMLSNSGSNQTYSHTTRASPATVQWLLDNYETAEGVSLPRSTLYCHYLLHCQEQKLEPVNAASFGKLIRSVFMGLRTRRLGTRGNSKYHYYGLRIKASSPLLRLMEDQQHLAMRQQPFSQKQRLKPVQKVEGMTNGMALGTGQQQGSGLSDISSQVQQYQQFLDASRALPEFSEVDLQGKALPDGISLEHIKSFQVLYREHCEAILDVMINLQFTLVETLWKTFWRYSDSQTSEGAALPVHDESEKRLPKACLVLLCKYEPVLRWSRECDNTLYQGLVEILIPDVLRPIPSALTQAIRNFAKSLESWLTTAMMNIPEEMVRVKVTSASAFAQTLRRYTSLNHLAQAARAVLQNTAQINQMLSDLNRVDFANVQEQASWVCRCEDRVVQRLEQDFKLTLQQQNSLEQWAAWLDGVVAQVLKPYQASPAFPRAAKLFLLKWSFYSSMVIRDLTLRSAASFGSFHLIRLLYDEYMYYLIEHRVAQAKGETPIAVMGEFASLGRSLNTLDPDKEEEEEEEEESDEECSQELSLPSDSSGLPVDSLEPPTKLPRTDPRGLFSTAPPDN